MAEPKFVHIASAEDRGAREGERTLGVYLKAKDAHKAVKAFKPPEYQDEDVKWTLHKEFDQGHDSGAVHVTHYKLEDSQWWNAYVIKFEVRG